MLLKVDGNKRKVLIEPSHTPSDHCQWWSLLSLYVALFDVSTFLGSHVPMSGSISCFCNSSCSRCSHLFFSYMESVASCRGPSFSMYGYLFSFHRWLWSFLVISISHNESLFIFWPENLHACTLPLTLFLVLSLSFCYLILLLSHLLHHTPQQHLDKLLLVFWIPRTLLLLIRMRSKRSVVIGCPWVMISPVTALYFKNW